MFEFETFAEKFAEWERADRRVRKRAEGVRDADHSMADEFDRVRELQGEARAAFRAAVKAIFAG